MSCKDCQNQIVLSFYEELQEGERVAFETHLRECQTCRAVLEEHKGFHAALAEDVPEWDLPADLLVESRHALANELDLIESKRERRRWWRVPTFSLSVTPMRMLESAALIAMGLALGVYVSNHQLDMATDSARTASGYRAMGDPLVIPQDGAVSNVRIVSADASTGQVEFAGDVIQPLRFQGHLEDETTRRLLFSAVQDPGNPGSRMQALDVLAQKSSEPSVKEVLIHALLNDGSLGVRLRAFRGLAPMAGDESVRAAFMQALMSDPNDGIRVGVVDALAPFTKSEAMASEIEEVTRHDDNVYVRLKGQGLIHLAGDAGSPGASR